MPQIRQQKFEIPWQQGVDNKKGVLKKTLFLLQSTHDYIYTYLPIAHTIYEKSRTIRRRRIGEPLIYGSESDSVILS